MKDAGKTKNILITFAAFASIVFAMYGFLFWSIKEKNEQISQLTNEANRNTQTDTALRGIKSALNNNKNSVVQVDSYFIPKEGVVDFINTLDTLGKESGTTLVIGAVSTEEDRTEANSFKETLKLRLETSGSWQETYYFLSKLESLPYHISINQTTFSLTSATDRMSFVNASTTDATKRVQGSDEYWKGSFDITVLKLK